MNTKTDEGLYEKARKLFISKASIDEFAGWATPRQVDAVHRLLDTELANRERAKHDRLLRRARFPVVKGLDGYDFTDAGLPDGYTPGRAPGTRFHPARAGPGVLRQDRARKDTSRDRAGHEGDRHGAGRAVPPDRRARPPAGQGQTRRHARDDAPGHRPCRPDHTGRVRLRTLRHRRGAPALAGSSRAATKDGASYSPRTSSSVNGARSSRTTNSPPRPATASCTTGGSSSPRARAAAPARPSCSAGTPPRNRKNKENACNRLNPKKIHD